MTERGQISDTVAEGLPLLPVETERGFRFVFDEAEQGCTRIARGPRVGRISLTVSGDRMFILVSGEPKGECLVDCFREGLALNVIQPSMRTLVDLTGFIGPVDWRAVFTVRTLASWGTKERGTAPCVAYVVRNDMFGGLIKVVSEIFFSSTHRAFDNRSDAIVWLESRGRADRE